MIDIKMLKRLWKDRWVFRSLPYTIYFNYHYLPLRQAILLPIWLYKPHLIKCGGKVVISQSLGGKIRPGMITLGKNIVSIFPANGIAWENRGTIIFQGKADIGNNSYLSTGEKAIITIGDRFLATTTLKLVSYDAVSIGNKCTIGWDCIIMDTDFHSLTKLDGSHTKGYNPVCLGNDTWIANGCRIYKNVHVPDHVVVASNTILTSTCDNIEEYSVIANNHKVGIISKAWLNVDDCEIIY